MFYFHAGVVAEVDVVGVFGRLEGVVLNPHEHVESLISFRLTIFNAFHFPFVLWCYEVKIDAVFVTFFKKYFW